MKELAERFSQEKRIALRLSEKFQYLSSLAELSPLPDQRYRYLAERANRLYLYFRSIESVTEELADRLDKAALEIGVILDESTMENKSVLNRINIDSLL